MQSVALQGHAGVLSECSACHNGAVPSTTSGGPHGLHPVGQSWLQAHERAARDLTACAGCHGADYRGTALSRALSDRTINAGEFGTRAFRKGTAIGCYSCHNGPRGS